MDKVLITIGVSFIAAGMILLLINGGPLPGNYYQTGVASWYGPNFQGNRTANGEIFDMNKLTAAHKSLPFGTVVRVVNLENGRSVVVKINDRGPFIKNRIIDLSRAAARKINMIGPGTAEVGLVIRKWGETN